MKIKILNSQNLNETQELNLVLATNNIQGECLIGRSPNSGLVLDSPDVSRLHGKFFQHTGSYYFCDFGSRNGSIVNGNLAIANQSYPIKPGDIVRIGEFVMILEEMDVIREDIPETVFGGGDATVISGWRSPAISPTVEIDSGLEVEKETAEPISAVEAMTASAESLQSSVAANKELAENHAQLPEIETLAVEEIESSSIQQPETESESTYVQLPEILNEAVEATFIQPLEVVANLETTAAMAQLSEEIVATETTHIQFPVVGETSDIFAEESTTVEAPMPVSADEMLTASSSDEIEVFEETEELSLICSEVELFEEIEEPSLASLATEEAIDEASNVVIEEIDNHITQSADIFVLEELESVPDVEPIAQTSEAIALTEADVNEICEGTSTQQEELYLDSELESVTPSATTPSIDRLMPTAIDFVTDNPISHSVEDVETIDAVSPVFEIDEAANEATIITEPINPQVSEETSQISQPMIPTQADAPSIPTDWQEPEFSQVIGQASPSTAAAAMNLSVEEKTVEMTDVEEQASTIASQKYIALMAHESKKLDLAQFVSEHQSLFSQCLTIATPAISETIYQVTGIEIVQQTPVVPVGGYQAIASLVSSGDILAVILLRDVLQAQPGQANEEALLRLCDINQVSFATNVSTAKAIVHYITTLF